MTNGYVAASWTGGEELAALLDHLNREVPAKVLRPALTKAIRVLGNAIRKRVPQKYVRVRQTVGTRVMTAKKTSVVSAKAGFGVGKQTAAKLASAVAKEAKRKGTKRPGVGISSRNVHWLVLGTADRETGYKTRRRRGVLISKRTTGNAVAFRGRIDPEKIGLAGAVKLALASSERETMAVLLDATMTGLDKQIAKLRK